MDDNTLMLKVKAGDLDKMALLYERHNRNLFGFFYKLTGSGSASEDLVHNVFYRMMKYSHTYNGEGSSASNFTAWMYHLARNVNADHYKKQRKVAYSDDMQPWERRLKVDENAESQLSRMQELELLAQAIRQLSTDKQEMLVMTKYQGLKYEQVAAVFGITEGAVKVRIHRILQELRDIYLKLEKV